MAWVYFIFGMAIATLVGADLFFGWLGGEPLGAWQAMIVLLALILSAVAMVALRLGVLIDAIASGRRAPSAPPSQATPRRRPRPAADGPP